MAIQWLMKSSRFMAFMSERHCLSMWLVQHTHWQLLCSNPPLYSNPEVQTPALSSRRTGSALILQKLSQSIPVISSQRSDLVVWLGAACCLFCLCDFVFRVSTTLYACLMFISILKDRTFLLTVSLFPVPPSKTDASNFLLKIQNKAVQ